MKRALIAIPVILVTLIAVLLVAPGFMNWNQYKEQAVAQIKKATGHDVVLNGDLSLALLPSPQFHIADVSVKAPAGSSEENLAKVERLDVHVAALPLLKGQVSVSSLELINPVIALETRKDGSANWMTPELEAMKSKPEGQGEAAGPAISLDNVHIKNGTFRFINTQKGSASEISAINVDIDADTLQGPFALDGSFAFAGQDIEFEAKTGKIESGAQSVSVNAKARFGKVGAQAQYAGIVGLVAPYEIQGEAALSVSSVGDALKAYGMKNAPLQGSGVLKGIITASQEAVIIENAVLELADQQFAADIKAGLKPLAVVSTFTAQKSVNLDAFMNQEKQSDGSADLKSVNALVPPTISVPMPFDASVEIVLPSATYKGQAYSNITLAFVKKDSQFQGKIAAVEIPGKGSVEAGAALEYGSHSATEAGGVTYSEPALSVFVKGKSQNVAQSAAALTGKGNLSYVREIKTGSLDIRAAVSPEKLQLQDSVIKLDDATFNLAGSYMPDGGAGRPKLVVELITNTLDIDRWKGTKQEDAAEPKKGDSLDTTLKTLALPYDVDFDIGIQNARLEGQDIKGLRVQGGITRNAATLKALSAQNFAGASVSASGKVADLQNLTGVEFNGSVDAQNIRTFLQTIGQKADGIPSGVTAAKIVATGKGNAQSLDLTANIEAGGGKLIVDGKVTDPLGKPAASNIKLQIKHPSTAQAIKIFAPDAPNYTTLSKPLDVYAEIHQNGTVYSLQNLKADVAGSAVEGSLSADTASKKPNVKAELRFGDLVIQSGPVTGGATRGVAGGSSAPPKAGQWSSDPIDSGFLHGMNADIGITANSIKYEGWDLAKPALKLSLNDGVLNIQKLNSGLFGGQVDMTGTVKSAAKDQPVSLQTSAKLSNVNIEPLARAFSKTGRLQGKGQVSMNVDVAGSGVSQAALVSSLKGSSAIEGRQLVLEGFDLAALATALMDSNKPLPRLQEIVTASTSGGQTAFDTLDGQYAINNGIVNITNMRMDGPAALIASTGNVSIPQWFIDTSHNVTLKNAKEVAPFNVVIKGPLSNPGNTFGRGMFDSILRSKIQEKVMEKLPDVLGDDVSEKLQQFGILPKKQTAPVPPPTPAAPQEVAPSGGEPVVPAPEPAPPVQQQEEITPEKAIQGILQNLIDQ